MQTVTDISEGAYGSKAASRKFNRRLMAAHLDLVCGWHPFVELVKDGGEHSLQSGHVELHVWVHVVQSVFSQCFYDVPNVHQVHYIQ